MRLYFCNMCQHLQIYFNIYKKTASFRIYKALPQYTPKATFQLLGCFVALWERIELAITMHYALKIKKYNNKLWI